VKLVPIELGVGNLIKQYHDDVVNDGIGTILTLIR